MARQLEARPGFPEDRRAQAAGVRHLHDEKAAGGEPLEHAANHGHGIRHMLEDVEGRDHVEAPGREGRRQGIADVDLVGESLGLGRGGVIDLDARDLPPERLGGAQRAAGAAAHVEIAAPAPPGGAVPADPPPERPRSETREQADGRIAEVRVAERGRQGPACRPDPTGRALEGNTR